MGLKSLNCLAVDVARLKVVTTTKYLGFSAAQGIVSCTLDVNPSSGGAKLTSSVEFGNLVLVLHGQMLTDTLL